MSLGRHTPDYSMLSRIAEILGLPVAYFYAGSDDLAELIKIYMGLDKKQQQTIISALNKPLL